ncbi:hypothetical protein [Oceanivirga salmonicida]|uniref:hypothetical protein n=1 Tax=Oceanivirga salmonicida TaxID=1769291 RepID=UPI00083623AF|nr:hypothetical protein [Oceanivirga salmonicida]
MKKLLFTLATLVSLSGFAAKATPFISVRAGYALPLAGVVSVGGGATWNVPIDERVSVDLGVKGKVRLSGGIYRLQSAGALGVGIIPAFTWNLNIKTDNKGVVGYVGTDLGVGVSLGFVPHTEPSLLPTWTVNLFGGVKLNRHTKIGGFFGSDGIGVDYAYLF